MTNFKISALIGMSLVLYLLCVPCSAGSSATAESVEKRTYHFNRINSVGGLFFVRSKLYATREAVNSAHQFGIARGDVTAEVPAGQEVMLIISPAVFQNPDMMKTIDGKGIDRLKVSSMSMDESTHNVCDAVVKYLPTFKELHALDMEGADATDGALSGARSLQKLISVTFALSSIRGSCFQYLTALPKLTAIDATGCSLDPKCVKYLPEIKNLKSLILRRTLLNDHSVEQLSKCSNLTLLDIRNNPGVTDASMPQLLALRKLRTLDLRGCSVTLKGLETIKSMKLAALGLPKGTYSSPEMATLKSMFPETNFEFSKKGVSKTYKMLFAPLR